MKHYGIEVIGYGKRTCYTIKKVTPTGLICPVDYRRYRTEAAAREAADELGIKIEAVGDCYVLLSRLTH